jgi:hypothetical protein
MPLLPHYKFELQSPLTPDRVVETLAGSVEPKRWLRLRGGDCPFQGKVTESEFEISRIIRYRNSFLPQIRGTIAPDRAGSRVSISMRLHYFVLVFMALWFSFVAMGCAISIVALALGSGNAIGVVITAGMVVFGWALCVGSFTFEARKAERLLTELLRANLVVRADGRGSTQG